jgi:hypothetical protein
MSSLLKLALAITTIALEIPGEYHSTTDHDQEPIHTQSRLEWYLPISANKSFGFHPTHDILMISTPYSIAGINISDGAYKYNSTFSSKSVCTKLVDLRLVTLSADNHVGQWNIHDGKGIDWIQIGQEFDGDETLCDVHSPHSDLTTILHHGKYIVTFDFEGTQLWNYTSIDTIFTQIESTLDYVIAIGRKNDRLVVYDFGIEDGQSELKMDAEITVKNPSKFVAVGLAPVYLVWTDENVLKGYHIDHDIELDFSVLNSDIPHFSNALKRVISLDNEFNKQANFVVEFIVDDLFHYVLIHVIDHDEETSLEYHLLEPVLLVN